METIHYRPQYFSLLVFKVLFISFISLGMEMSHFEVIINSSQISKIKKEIPLTRQGTLQSPLNYPLFQELFMKACLFISQDKEASCLGPPFNQFIKDAFKIKKGYSHSLMDPWSINFLNRTTFSTILQKIQNYKKIVLFITQITMYQEGKLNYWSLNCEFSFFDQQGKEIWFPRQKVLILK